jgi:alkylation response protein AidB-like acyl-CoA dehydrogenase
MILDDEHQAFRQSIRSLAQKHVAPIADELDRTDQFPDHLRRVFADAGLIQLAIPEEFGGPGGDLLASCIAREEVAAAGSMALAQLAGQNTIFSRPVVKHGSEELRHRLLPDLAKGDLITCIMITEPDIGSDPALMTTKAVRDGDSWIINGTKQFITWGSMADYAMVFARTNDEPRGRGISCFAVDTKTPGFQVVSANDKMGQHGVPNNEILLQDVRIPDSNMVGPEGQGFRSAMEALDQNRPTVAAIAVGGAQAAFDYAVSYAKERTIGGAPIVDFQGLRWMIADMATSIEAARNLVYSCAQAWDTGAPAVECNKLASMAKLFAAETVQKVTTDSLQLLGGHGYMRDHPMERYMRDARLMSIYEGTSQIQRNIIAKIVLR